MSDRLLVLVRHGQSEWNLKNLFTGWKDPDLTEKGVAEAIDAGRKLKAQALSFDIAFTSVLLRAQHTLDLLLTELGQTGLPVKKHLALNERDYGDLSGLNKAAARRRKPEGHAGAHPALLRSGNIAVRTARRARAGVSARQLAARADHGAGEALAEGNSGAGTRHRRADHLPAQCGCHRRIEARSRGVIRRKVQLRRHSRSRRPLVNSHL